MNSELEKQMEHIERMVADLAEAIRKLHQEQVVGTGEVNARLELLLKRRNKD